MNEEELKKEIELFNDVTGHNYNYLGDGFSFGKQPVKEFIKLAKQQGKEEMKKEIDKIIKKDLYNWFQKKYYGENTFRTSAYNKILSKIEELKQKIQTL